MNSVRTIFRTQLDNFTGAARDLTGNARILLVTNFIGWTIQFAYIGQYLPLYLTSPQIGVPKAFYGTLCSITALTATIGGMLSGAIAARFRAKIVLLCGDLTTFAVSAVLYVFADNTRPGLLVLAAMCGGVWSFHNSCFHLLLTKGQNKERLPRMYAFYNIAITGVGLVTPLAGMLLVRFELISLTRVMLLTTAGLVLIAALTRVVLLDEYRPENDAVPPRGLGIQNIFSVIASENRSLKMLLLVVFLNGLCGVARFSYSGIYYTDGLGIAKAAISVLPAISSIVVVVATLFAAPHFTAARANTLLRTAFLLFFLADIGLLCAPRQFLPWLMATSIAMGIAGFLLMSLINSTIMNMTKLTHWPFLIGINVPLASLAGIIAGPIIGALYGINPRIPFAVSAVLSGSILFLVFRTDFSPRHAADPVVGDIEAAP